MCAINPTATCLDCSRGTSLTLTGNENHEASSKKELENQLGDVPMTLADITKAKKDLNYEPKTTLYEGLFRTFDSIKNSIPKPILYYYHYRFLLIQI